MAEDSANGLTQQIFSQKQPLVSVVIPCYNAEKYVEQAVRSIMNQTYKNLEILITDDCSTDASFAILQKLAEEDARIKLFRNEYNQKIVRTLNALVERATGKYIARMDADDISLPKRIEKQVAFLEANPDIALCGTNAWHIDESDKSIGGSSLPVSFEDCKYFSKFFSPFYHPSILLCSRILKDNLYSENFIYAEDYELWCRVMFQKNFKCVNLKCRLLEYRIYPNQTSKLYSEKQIESVSNVFKTYNLVEKSVLEFHLNVFYKQTTKNFEEKEYLLSLCRELKKKSFVVNQKIAEKILFFMHSTKLFDLRIYLEPILFICLVNFSVKKFAKFLRGN